MLLQFPKKFIWGAGVSSHQTEGNNTNNDWWEWEQRGKTVDKSGWATDSWNRYMIDHDLARDLGCDAYRISLEWSRIEPNEGEFSEEALEHYKKVLVDIKSKGMMRAVTLWHYTSPLWFVHKYDWHHEKAPEFFARYCQKVMDYLGEEIEFLITLNEPRLVLNRGFLLGNRPPGRHNPLAFLKARRNMVEAHRQSYSIVKKYHKDIPVGLTQFCNDIDYKGKSKAMNRLVEKCEDFYNWHFFTEIGDMQDFIGINYYFTVKVKSAPPFYSMRTLDNRRTDMGWGVWPEGLHEVVMDAWQRYRKPIVIWESGIADKKDRYRGQYIRDHLRWLHQAIEDGADVLGYFYWSLLDNYEWEDGYSKRFGLVHVNYKSMLRTPRPSYYYYQKVIKQNGIEL